MLAYRDGAELIATVHAFGLGAASPAGRLTAAIVGGGLSLIVDGIRLREPAVVV